MNVCRAAASICALVWLISWLGVADGAESEDRKRLVELAQKEGQVVFYTSMDAGDARLLTQAFQKKYPAIKTDFYRAGREAVFSALRSSRRRPVTLLMSLALANFTPWS